MKDYEGAEYEAEEHRKEREQGAYERVVESLVDDLMRGETIGRRYGYAIDLAYVIDGYGLLDTTQLAHIISGDAEARSEIIDGLEKRARSLCEEYFTEPSAGYRIVEACVEDEIAEGRE